MFGVYPDAKSYTTTETQLQIATRVMLPDELGGDDPAPSLISSRGLSVLIHESLMNNSLEAMPNGGRLVIRLRALPFRKRTKSKPPATHVIVRFRDHGVGMSAEQTERIFTSLLSSTKPKGTGIGMAIVARVVDAHQGVVRVKSRPGCGATFTIVLPVNPS